MFENEPDSKEENERDATFFDLKSSWDGLGKFNKGKTLSL